MEKLIPGELFREDTNQGKGHGPYPVNLSQPRPVSTRTLTGRFASFWGEGYSELGGGYYETAGACYKVGGGCSKKLRHRYKRKNGLLPIAKHLCIKVLNPYTERKHPVKQTLNTFTFKNC